MDEKAKKVLEIFTETQDVYQLKEIEKLAPKKGVISQSVKEVVNGLVADNLLETDKIGSSTYFWIFTDKLTTQKKAKMDKLIQTVKELKSRKADLAKKISASAVNEEEMHQREKYTRRIERNKKKITELKAEVEKFKDCDPVRLNQMKEEVETCRESVERWTTNVMAIRTWAANKMSVNESEIGKQMGIPDGFDYVDDDD